MIEPYSVGKFNKSGEAVVALPFQEECGGSTPHLRSKWKDYGSARSTPQ